MTPEELEKICKDFYGRCWQTKLSADLGISARQVRNLASGYSAITPQNETCIRLYTDTLPKNKSAK